MNRRRMLGLTGGFGAGFVVTRAAGAALREAAGSGSAAERVDVSVNDTFVAAQTNVEDGTLGERMRINVNDRLMKLRLEDILAPFEKRPGVQEWVGEHVGKFLHAASLSCRTPFTELLRKRVDETARKLVATQPADGYLGTYADKDRWTSWDVWSHKYSLVGLLAHHSLTGSARSLTACKRAGDLLCRTFGFGAGQLDLVSDKHSTGMGMASGSVLEPMALLHRRTGDPKYLAFCKYILAAWEQPHGPKLVSSLVNTRSVYKTANRKAYEMMANLVGLLELYRTTGDPVMLDACRAAWEDVSANRLYVLGTTSWAESFQADHDLRPDGSWHGPKYVAGGEGCVTVTWMQLSLQLLRLTGELRYADALERTAYNALIGAQSITNGQVSYFSPLVGRKRFGEVDHGITPDISCCASSIPRGIAMVADMMAGTVSGDPALLFYESARHLVSARTDKGVQRVELRVTSQFPLDGAIRVTVIPAVATKFALRLRVPAWASTATARVGSETFQATAGQWLVVDRRWALGDVVELQLPMELRVLPAGPSSPKHVVVERGPEVLATDETVDFQRKLPPFGWHGKQLYTVDAPKGTRGEPVLLIPFSQAGQTRGNYSVLVDAKRV